MEPRLALSLLASCALCACAPDAAALEAGDESGSSEEDESESESESASESDASESGEEPPAVDGPLVGDNCEVEILWVTRDFALRDMLIDQAGGFVLVGTGHDPEDGTPAVNQATLRVVDGELQWTAIQAPQALPRDSSARAVRILERPDGELWAFGAHDSEGESFIVAYGPDGEQRWITRHPGEYWTGAGMQGDHTYVWSYRSDPGPRLHRIDAQGQLEWSFELDDDPTAFAAVAVRDGLVWAAGHRPQDCAWHARWTTEGQLLGAACPPPIHEYELSDHLLVLDNGDALLGGYQQIKKPTQVGQLDYGEPLIMLLDSEGVERSRWTYAADEWWGGRVAALAELPGGGFVAASNEVDQSAETDYGNPTLHRFDQDAGHLLRCELDRPQIPNYAGVFFALSVSPAGEIYALLRDSTVSSSAPRDDPDDFPPVPKDFYKHMLVKITI